MDGQLYLHIGLENGVLLRTGIDSITGSMSDSRSKFLGVEPIRLAEIVVKGQKAVLALSSKPYLCYDHHGQYTITPLSYESLEHACSFSSTQCFEGIVGIKGNDLRIIQVERLGELFTQKLLQTRYTPTKVQVNPITNHIVVLEKEYNCYTLSQREALKLKLAETSGDQTYKDADFQRVGYPRPGNNGGKS